MPAPSGGSFYCQAGDTFPTLTLLLLGFGVLNLLGIPLGLLLRKEL
jgi:hypothetical protein